MIARVYVWFLIKDRFGVACANVPCVEFLDDQSPNPCNISAVIISFPNFQYWWRCCSQRWWFWGDVSTDMHTVQIFLSNRSLWCFLFNATVVMLWNGDAYIYTKIFRMSYFKFFCFHFNLYSKDFGKIIT
jgi:hypothetical protein